MTIDEVAKHFRVTKSKLRYYEKNGVIKEIDRDENGNRVYTKQDLVWINFFLNLKDTGMTLKEIKHYIGLKKGGEATIEERKQILIDQAEAIEEKIAELEMTRQDILDQVKRYDEEQGACIIKGSSHTEEECS